MVKAVDFIKLHQSVKHLEQAAIAGLIGKSLFMYFEEHCAHRLHPFIAGSHHPPDDRELIPERIKRPRTRHRRLDALAKLLQRCKRIKKMIA
ncbi:hypothetical protein C9397_11905 [Xanthomonas vasicola pv. vasculorum]|uniref:Uncharacterized protein n=1 Tax=Xanthomonas vasicola pv. vasculorum TaxID=325776 RepID=A0AAE8F5S1_XANVA|nr:hypothetical protein C7V42_06495 [Xanthomonas vasicola pv. vasculorum]RJL81350.1 hypothetical protein DEG03_018040 [Xanthomonas vasicola]AZM70506.1 hypothetical protein CXP37_06500 [Xanthomonas vasicola pv. vasculorum]PUE69277.1 hypothetical protein C7Y63_13710 [Xanthomonas vasicola pv. vasculorum]PUE73313.1 hypothetical protein C7Y61_13665 [Xanthomonas vasicola pv. vasculorum]